MVDSPTRRAAVYCLTRDEKCFGAILDKVFGDANASRIVHSRLSAEVSFDYESIRFSVSNFPELFKSS